MNTDIITPEIKTKNSNELIEQIREDFIGLNMKIEPVIYDDKISITDILSYYMGKNTLERQKYIMDNLKIENV